MCCAGYLPELRGILRPALLRLTGSKLDAVVGSAMLILLLSIAAAWLSFRFYEAPFLKLKRFFLYRKSPLPQTGTLPR